MVVVVMAVGCIASGAFAQKAQLNDAQVKERLTYIENALYNAQPGAQAWWGTWISLYGSAVAVQGGLAGAHWNDWKYEIKHHVYMRKIRNRSFAEDMLVGGCTATIAVGGKLIFPFKPAYLPNRLRSMPGETPAERLDKLARAEDILRACAQTEVDGWGWLTHVLNIVVNAGAGLTTVLAFHRPWTDGLITFAEGEAISLVDVFSQPRRAIKDLKDYEAKYGRGEKGGANDPYDNEIFFSLYETGVGVGMKF
jgi:hypothetical protein